MKRLLLSGLAVTAVSATLAAGCGSGNRTIAVPASTPTPTPLATPTPIGATPTPTPTPVASTRAGDFAFASSATNSSTGAITLSSDGTGSASFSLQSVNGFTSPITFASTVTATTDVDGSSVNPGAVSVTFSPASLASLPAGITPATLSIKAPTTLPPLTRVHVAINAQGGGLKRYPSVGPYDNGGGFDFLTPGLLFTSFDAPFYVPGTTTVNIFTGNTGSTLSAVASIETVGLNGTATFAITGLPTGVIATFDTPTLAVTPTPAMDAYGSPANPQVVVTFTATQDIPPGNHSVHITATLNGITYTSAELNISPALGGGAIDKPSRGDNSL